MKRDQISVNDRQLACARISSPEGQDYLKGMAAAGNYAWVNRSSMTFLTRQVSRGGGGAGGGGAWFHTSSSFQAFSKVFATTPDDLDMHVIYDVSHNIAKVEEHVVDGRQRTLLVHRKGSTRAFPPHHPLIPVDYQVCVSTHARTHTRTPTLMDALRPQLTGQPVLIGGTMGTCSYVLTGTEQGMTETFGTTCHGAVGLCCQATPRPPNLRCFLLILRWGLFRAARCLGPSPAGTWTSRTSWTSWPTWGSPSEWLHPNW